MVHASVLNFYVVTVWNMVHASVLNFYGLLIIIGVVYNVFLLFLVGVEVIFSIKWLVNPLFVIVLGLQLNIQLLNFNAWELQVLQIMGLKVNSKLFKEVINKLMPPVEDRIPRSGLV